MTDKTKDNRPSHHWNSKSTERNDEDEEKDPYELIMEKSGCASFHFALQDCMYEKRDWRMCKEEMEAFKNCMANVKQQKKT